MGVLVQIDAPRETFKTGLKSEKGRARGFQSTDGFPAGCGLGEAHQQLSGFPFQPTSIEPESSTLFASVTGRDSSHRSIRKSSVVMMLNSSRK